jgi:hypothetical protein
MDDWTFTASEMLINGVLVTPQQGDRIHETLNGVTVVYEGMPVGTRKPCEFLDTSGILLTVHSKKVF